MFARTFIRATAVAIGLSTLSFAAGVAGDLSLTQTPNYGERVVLRIPPAISGDVQRASPLLSTASAEALAPLQRQRRARFAPISVRSADADLLVNESEELAMVRLPKLRIVWAAKPAERLASA